MTLPARISPDGRYLAYVSNQHGRYSLWIRQIATASAVETVPAGSDTIIDFTFTSDGAFLDYLCSRERTNMARCTKFRYSEALRACCSTKRIQPFPSRPMELK